MFNIFNTNKTRITKTPVSKEEATSSRNTAQRVKMIKYKRDKGST